MVCSSWKKEDRWSKRVHSDCNSQYQCEAVVVVGVAFAVESASEDLAVIDVVAFVVAIAVAVGAVAATAVVVVVSFWQALRCDRT